MPIKVTADIFIDRVSIPGFNPIPYQINIAHPVIEPLFNRFFEINHLPKHYPLSDKQRLTFEKWIFDLIKEGKIIVE